MIVKESIYVPGSLFPVNPFGLNNIENLFPRNERLITIALNKKVGKMAIVKIGATFVGRIKVFYDRLGVNGFSKKFHKKYKKKIKMEKGHELGMFEMGSAVMLFFEKSRIKFARTVKKNNEIKVGEKIATVV